ncbi:MAG: hypothetical protein D8M56_18830 [Chloroflexi bacterium]|nr:hypothetical protein [Chloroflexota bacterium]
MRKAIWGFEVFIGIMSLWILVVKLGQELNFFQLGQTHSYSEPVLTSTPTPIGQNFTYAELNNQVAPPSGTTINVVWGDIGQKLVDAGAIDLIAYQNLIGDLSDKQQEILLHDTLQHITLTPDNIQFWTNVLWALGLTQHSKVLDEGPMMQFAAEVPLDNYASTGGWTLGRRNAIDLYNSAELIKLTSAQQDLVYQVAETIFRPCCGNHTAYPDCNHGMALLGLLELLAAQGATASEMYDAALIFNSYAFQDTYITLAAYFESQGTAWSDLDPVTVLGAGYSSGQSAYEIALQVGPIPGSPNQAGGCSVE